MPLQLLKSITGHTLIESHRGMIGPAPENSWAAIRLGRQAGADLIEMDVQMSRDGVPFIRHNYQLPDGRWCNRLDWAALEKLEIDGEPLPRLDDVLAWARENGACLSLDIKSSFGPQFALSETVIGSLDRTNTRDIVLLLFFDHDELFHVKKAEPDLAVRALVRGRFVNFAAYLKSIGADCASLAFDLFRPADVAGLHAAGIAAALDGLWDPNADVLEKCEIDILAHDHPAGARRLLERAS